MRRLRLAHTIHTQIVFWIVLVYFENIPWIETVENRFSYSCHGICHKDNRIKRRGETISKRLKNALVDSDGVLAVSSWGIWLILMATMGRSTYPCRRAARKNLSLSNKKLSLVSLCGCMMLYGFLTSAVGPSHNGCGSFVLSGRFCFCPLVVGCSDFCHLKTLMPPRIIPSGNQTWPAGKSPSWMEVSSWENHGPFYGPFSSTPCLTSGGYTWPWVNTN